MTWSDVTIAGAFIAGIVLGAAGAIRITRIVWENQRNDPGR